MYIVCAHTHSAVILQNYYQITRQGSAGVQADGRHLSNHVHDEVVLTASGYIQEYAVICSTYISKRHIYLSRLGQLNFRAKMNKKTKKLKTAV